ncbi:MAG: DUF502 domain-containing protein [Bdellovibrionota bacterium]
MNGSKILSARLREYLVLGLVMIAPLAVTFWVLATVVLALDELIYRLIPVLRGVPDSIGFGLPGIGMLATFVALLGFGALAKTFAGRMFSSFIDALLSHVPVIRGFYGATKQISAVFFSQSPTSAFKKVVYVPFPGPGSKALAFVSSSIDEDNVFVFVPTAPNPTSGYVLRYHRSQLEDTTLTIDAALQLVISCGAVNPGKAYDSGKV